jgi:hypothetical protein
MALHRRTVESIAGFIRELFCRAGQAPPERADEMAIVGLASGTGAVAELMADSTLDVALFSDNFPAALVSVAATQKRNELP